MTRLVQGHRARKRFGQNFLQDPTIIQQILQLIAVSPDDHIVEIGPGMGALTNGLTGARRLDLVELDRDLVPRLEAQFANQPHVQVNSADALEFDYGALLTDDQAPPVTKKPKLRIVGNLPYNISTPLIFHLLESATQISDMHFMLQKEVVKRLTASPGESNYGRLSIMTQYWCDNEDMLDVPPSAFAPAPKVDSAIVRLCPFESPPHPCTDLEALNKIVSQAFSQRRKSLRNALKSFITEEEFERLDIDAGLRPERLSVADFVKLCNHWVNHHDS